METNTGPFSQALQSDKLSWKPTYKLYNREHIEHRTTFLFLNFLVGQIESIVPSSKSYCEDSVG